MKNRIKQPLNFFKCQDKICDEAFKIYRINEFKGCYTKEECEKRYKELEMKAIRNEQKWRGYNHKISDAAIRAYNMVMDDTNDNKEFKLRCIKIDENYNNKQYE